ncbi:unnamed protein product [Blepharisma stoltei]|uniref:Uncharacterized protein n=1 Tax=Blepharisma stoltei TaxID=1481888 RepID=A0AAU9KDK7_9CILI|nr:unnamed protein product [Blepharisma stoltei]
MRLFGKKKKQNMKPEEVLKTMESLRKTIEDIEKRSTLLQNKAQMELQNALQRKKQGDRAGALISLKRKKMYETEASKLEGSRMNIEQQLFAIEGASMNKNIFDSLKTGNQALKQVHGEIKIEDVDKLKDEMEEQQDLVQELNEAISQPIGFMSTVDEDDLLKELDEIEAQEYERDLIEAEPSQKAMVRPVVEQPSLELPGKEQPQVLSNFAGPQPQQPVKAAQNNELDELFNSMQM